MRVLNSFTIRSLILNKKRTITTIIGIMLSTALICGVAGLVASAQHSLVVWTCEKIGEYHIAFENVKSEDMEYIKENDEIKKYFTTQNYGWAKLDEIQNIDKPYLKIMGYDKDALDCYGISLLEGRMPENSHELLISNHIISNGRADLKVGSELTLDVGNRITSDGSLLNKNNPYIHDSENESGESLIDTQKITYKIVGRINRLYSERYSEPGYTCITLKENDGIKQNIYMLLKEPANYENVINDVEEKFEIENTITNGELLRYQGVLSDGALNALYGIAGVIITIIIVTSVFVIRNSFSISVMEKTRQYGMLCSIGATSQQIKNNVIFEGLMIGLIAVPLGIFFGVIAIYILMQIVGSLLTEALRFSLLYKFEPISIVVSIVLSLITIYLSSIIPAIKASKLSPIEAIRGNNDIKIKSKKIKTPKFIKKLFGVGGVIADKNLKRSKKKYRTTVISIVVSVATFIALSRFFEIGNKITFLYYADYKYNMYVQNGNEETYKQIIDEFNIDDYAYFYSRGMNVPDEKYYSDYGKEYFLKDGRKSGLALIVYNDEYFKKYLKELDLTEKNFDKVAIMLDENMASTTNGVKVVNRIYNVEKGDNIEVLMNDKKYNITVSQCAEHRPMGLEGTFIQDAQMIVSKSYVKNTLNEDINDGFAMNSLCINSQNANDLEGKLNDLKKDDEKFSSISVFNYETDVAQYKRIMLVLKIFLYGFISVIALIGITNIFNTITTNMILRSKEFALLKAIGMTNKEFNKMITLESFMYGMKSLLFGIPLGLIASYFVNGAIEDGIALEYEIPIKAVLLSIIFVFIIVGITMRYSLKKINSQNIIETIRAENV